MEHARKQQVPKETISLSDTITLEEFDQKTTLFEAMTNKSKSFNKIPKQRALYHALMKSILEDEDAMDEGVADKLKKRKPNDADKDEGPSAGSDRGLKRQRTSKGTKTSKKTSATKDSSEGKSLTTSSKSSKSSKSAKDQVDKPISVQDSDDDAKFENADMPMDQGEDLGKSDEQPNDEAIPKYDWYMKSNSDTSPDPKWNEGKLIDDRPEQSWLNDMAKATKPPLTFDELMHTLINFSAFVLNRLQIDNLTKEILNNLTGTILRFIIVPMTKPLPVQMSSQGRQNIPADFFFNNDLEYLRGGRNDKKYTSSTTKSKTARYELKGIEDMVPNLWSPVKVVYDRYALLGISHWRTKSHNFYGYATKMVSKHGVYSTKRILSIISVKVNEWYGYGHLEEIVVKRADQKLYTFKEGDFKRLHLNDIEDMLLFIVQNKLKNLDGNVIVHLAASLRMFARRNVIQARVEDLQLGVESYQKKLNLTKPRTRDVDMSRRPAYTTLSNPQGV
ncbi:hypothetical protein Tco_0200264 [Tanacetum coccineum]